MANPDTVIEQLAEHVELTRVGIWKLCRRYEDRGLKAVYDAPRAGRPWELSPLQRVEIEQLACCAPSGIGLHMTHWSTRSLARVAVLRGVVPHIAHSTVSLLLRYADLQPHRSRYWKTPTIDETFRKRARAILWCYERVYDLAAEGEMVICLDEKPNLQVLERRCPTRPMSAGHIERQEFEYIRHGIINVLISFVVHTGSMRAWCPSAKDSEHLRPVLGQLFHFHRRARRLHIIWDGDPSHTADDTQRFLKRHAPWVQVHQTPAHASWLNQAELLLRAFRERYLRRGEWNSQDSLKNHIDASWREYNRLFAHPFTWSWTRAKMDRWIDRQQQSTN